MKISKELINNVDSGDMWGLISDFPNHWKEVMKLTEYIELNIDKSKIKNICFAGMGGSAIGADLIRAYSLKSCPYPVQVNRHYEIPNYIGENTLFITCSFSGNTEETLTAMSSALKNGAQVIGVTSGGELKKQAIEHEFDYIQIPGGMPPRAALAYSFVPLFRIFQYLGYLDEPDSVLDDTYNLLKDGVSKFIDMDDNDALALARELNESLPIIYSDASLMEPVNLRWRGQIEENSKMLAYGNLIPEMNHNEIVGWEHIAHLAGRLTVVMLKDQDDNPRVTKRMEIVKELVMDQALSVIEISTIGNSRLERVFSLVQLADWVSLYLALLNEIDPTPIAKIDILKSKLAEV
ncbi:MAG: bifunctional phosphoglucose/phosphomannose isomerase [Balneola sp.]|nr:bifunctional phosphoglucose/phosphomannose isomerase [Balneola sp.]MBO6651097.1 bifunctional phosphoglucose/phosphomannose isomerase [Balneola sp.]MBO6712778.1 bifunctional phosphoglucose/phosphomannose isomerase [Balneola sp.]MBO6801077.1 bifunctional phosphoglucose/phosphomannose isomerase [Balneola sp.]MBO6871269.1 bifunctional phosphoglucose/phosphomannose isomerase [Balneola sp.]